MPKLPVTSLVLAFICSVLCGGVLSPVTAFSEPPIHVQASPFESQSTQCHFENVPPLAEVDHIVQERLRQNFDLDSTSFSAIYLNKQGEILGSSQSHAGMMMRAASLPKIVILLGLAEVLKQQNLMLDAATETHVYRMMRRSSNESATEMIGWIGDHIAPSPQNIEFDRYKRGKIFMRETLLRYGLYNSATRQGLYLDKLYATDENYISVPIMNGRDGSGQAATADAVSCFYFKLHREELPLSDLILKFLYVPTASECATLKAQGQEYLCSLHHGVQSDEEKGWVGYQKGGSLPTFCAMAEGGIVYAGDKIMIVSLITRDCEMPMARFEQFVKDIQQDYLNEY